MLPLIIMFKKDTHTCTHYVEEAWLTGFVSVLWVKLLQRRAPKDNLAKLFISCLPNSPGQILKSGRWLSFIAVLQGPRLLHLVLSHPLGHKLGHTASTHITLEKTLSCDYTKLQREYGKGSSCMPRENHGFGRQQEVSVPISLYSPVPLGGWQKVPFSYGIHVKIWISVFFNFPWGISPWSSNLYFKSPVVGTSSLLQWTHPTNIQ